MNSLLKRGFDETYKNRIKFICCGIRGLNNFIQAAPSMILSLRRIDYMVEIDANEQIATVSESGFDDEDQTALA